MFISGISEFIYSYFHILFFFKNIYFRVSSGQRGRAVSVTKTTEIVAARVEINGKRPTSSSNSSNSSNNSKECSSSSFSSPTTTTTTIITQKTNGRRKKEEKPWRPLTAAKGAASGSATNQGERLRNPILVQFHVKGAASGSATNRE